MNFDKKNLKNKLQNDTLHFLKKNTFDKIMKNNFNKMIYDINQVNNNSSESNYFDKKIIEEQIIKEQLIKEELIKEQLIKKQLIKEQLIKEKLKNKIKVWIKSFLKIINEYKRYIEPIKKNQKGGNIIINNFIDKYNLNIIKKDKIENKKLLILNNLKGIIKIKKCKKDIEIIKLKNKLSEIKK